MGTAPTLTKGTMMSTNMNFVKPPTYGLIKDTHDQKNGHCGIRPLENAPPSDNN